jgi:tRNA(Ile)-lysidine synthetase-like protein
MPGRLVTKWRDLRFAPNTPAIVAVSGGADSVFLLHWLAEQRLGLRLYVAHVNHSLRGAESDADQEFVATLAKRLALPFRHQRVSPESSNEADLRRARLAALSSIAIECKARYIFLGHHADDLAEWLLLAALRGSGPRGLGGMEEVRHTNFGAIVRPLLEWRRDPIREWLKARSITWREDSSNDSDLYRRNRIRNEVMPLLESISPGAVESLVASAAQCRRVSRAYEEQCSAIYVGALLASSEPSTPAVALDARRLPGRIDPDLLTGVLQGFAGLAHGDSEDPLPPIRRSIVEQAANRIGAGIDEETRFQAGGVELLLTSRYWIAFTCGEELAWRAFRKALHFLFALDEEVSINLDRYQSIQGPEWLIETPGGTISASLEPRKPVSALGAVIDLGSLRGPLRLAPVNPGELIALRSGHKTVADCLKEADVPLAVRPMAWGFRDDEQIVWIPGVRQDARTLYRQGLPALGLRLLRRE